MPKGRRKFIDKKRADNFTLVHRSQRAPPSTENETVLTPEQRKAEQRKYGVYYDDEYNYLQHLKETVDSGMVLQPQHNLNAEKKEKTEVSYNVKEISEKLGLPTSLFASEVEEDDELLSEAAPQDLDFDPEIAAALDGNFDFDNPEMVLEDDFVLSAMGEDACKLKDYTDESSDCKSNEAVPSELSDCESNEAVPSESDNNDDSDEDEDEIREKMEMHNEVERNDTKRQFIQPSLSLSSITKNEQRAILDKQFEKMYAEYDDTEIGALDGEDIQGHIPLTHEALRKDLEEFEKYNKRSQLDCDKEFLGIQKARLEHIDEEESEEEMVTDEEKPKLKYDCESILSTYSNLHNHPKTIEMPPKRRVIRIDHRTGMPKDALDRDRKPTKKSLGKLNAMWKPETSDSDDEVSNVDTMRSRLSVLSIRSKDETPEEKKQRKQLLKEYRRDRRVEKKMNKIAFKEEMKRQKKVMLNNVLNVQGKKL